MCFLMFTELLVEAREGKEIAEEEIRKIKEHLENRESIYKRQLNELEEQLHVTEDRFFEEQQKNKELAVIAQKLHDEQLKKGESIYKRHLELEEQLHIIEDKFIEEQEKNKELTLIAQKLSDELKVFKEPYNQMQNEGNQDTPFVDLTCESEALPHPNNTLFVPSVEDYLAQEISEMQSEVPEFVDMNNGLLQFIDDITKKETECCDELQEETESVQQTQTDICETDSKPFNQAVQSEKQLVDIEEHFPVLYQSNMTYILASFVFLLILFLLGMIYISIPVVTSIPYRKLISNYIAWISGCCNSFAKQILDFAIHFIREMFSCFCEV